MALFRSQLHLDIWVEHHCQRCWSYDNGHTSTTVVCPIIGAALRTGRKPVAWERNPRKTALMAETIKCNAETRTPPKIGYAGPVTDETMTMFDVVTPDVPMDSEHQ